MTECPVLFEPASAIAAGICLTARTLAGGLTERHPRPCGWCDYELDDLRRMVDGFNGLVVCNALHRVAQRCKDSLQRRLGTTYLDRRALRPAVRRTEALARCRSFGVVDAAPGGGSNLGDRGGLRTPTNPDFSLYGFPGSAAGART